MAAANLRKPETVRDLLDLVVHLRDVLSAHQALWEGGVGPIVTSHRLLGSESSSAS